MKPLLVYLFIVNAAGFVLMLVDKYKAKKNLWRIPELTLLGIAAMGGSMGCLVGMYAVRHKTKHLKFTLGVPIILALQILLFVMLFL